MAKAKTYFEQVPVHVVKQIAVVDVIRQNAGDLTQGKQSLKRESAKQGAAERAKQS